jgi:IS5 family transposase
MDALLALVNRALAAQHVILTEGQIAIVDATVVEAAQSGFKTRDPEGGSSVKRGTKGKIAAVWGWKGFVNVDEDNFVQKVDFAPGNAAEVKHLERLLLGHEERLYADAAYIGPTTRALLGDTSCWRFWGTRRPRHRGSCAAAQLSQPQSGARGRDAQRRHRRDPRGGRARLWPLQTRLGDGANAAERAGAQPVWWAMAAVAWNLTQACRLRQTCG